MDRMKTFGLYALCVIAFFIFSNVMIDIAIKATYNSIPVEIEQTENLAIDTNEVKATYVNGYVSGKIQNMGQQVESTYIKIDLYSKRDVLLGTKYVRIFNLLPKETEDFRMGFKLTNADHCKISMIDEVPETATEEEFTSTELKFAALLTTVIFLCCFG